LAVSKLTAIGAAAIIKGAPFLGKGTSLFEERMTDHENRSDGNPLDEYAAQASVELGSRTTDFSNASVGHVESGQVSMRESFAQSIRSSAAYLEDAAAGLVQAGSVDAQDAAIGLVMAGEVRATTLNSAVVAARNMQSGEIHTGLLFAVNVRGDVHSTISPLAGLAIGAGFAATLIAVRIIFAVTGRRLASG